MDILIIMAAPGKERRILRLLHNLQLQALKRTPSFPVQRRHVDAEDAQEGVSLVFHSRRPPFRGPGHPLTHGCFEHIQFPREVSHRNSCGFTH